MRREPFRNDIQNIEIQHLSNSLHRDRQTHMKENTGTLVNREREASTRDSTSCQTQRVCERTQWTEAFCHFTSVQMGDEVSSR